MEEKERYYSVIDCNEDFVIRDCESNQTCKSLFEVKTLLNYQNREINRLTKMLYTTTKHADKLNEENNKLNKENQKLKQQLDEKEKEISNLNGLVRERDKQIKNLKTNKKRVIEHKNKTKISFALEQLEKVKENIKKVPITDFDLSGNFEKMYKQDAIRQIDNQIKELKGEE